MTHVLGVPGIPLLMCQTHIAEDDEEGKSGIMSVTSS